MGGQWRMESATGNRRLPRGAERPGILDIDADEITMMIRAPKRYPLNLQTFKSEVSQDFVPVPVVRVQTLVGRAPTAERQTNTTWR
jgi:hypothetical protein